ncbi:hypothetical protein EDB82DRAFT_198951 [Fusarium venenatum]|uniref:uncharacterized protein n=1 Tax=Fusarium venenatum TaxID=56646 RepID=UPI001DF08806|nr:hypothetical protein EDB82DRAFT_198951 [Fusarium venenatum]
MKRVKCCTACRRRHRKCVTWPGSSQCGTCLESGQECRFENDIRFKHSYREAQRDVRGEQAKVPSKISFTTPRGTHGSVLEGLNRTSVANKHVMSQLATESISEGILEIPTDGLMHSSQPEDVPVGQAPNYWESSSNFITSPPIHPSTVQVYDSHYPEGSSLPQASIPPVLDADGSFDNDSTEDLQRHTQDSFELTEREAFLFMTYIYKLAPSVSLNTQLPFPLTCKSDACDDARHFELEVPRLALRQPMMMNGLLALASRYDARCTNTSSDIESTFYHTKCIKLLIKAFAQPPETWDSILLTTVVIARLYEEYDNESDSYYHHLSGTQNLLNHEVIARFVMQGGLAEAASWVHLRQAIYIYVVHRKPIEIRLESFERSTVFRRSDDSAYANRAVYNFAKILKLFLSTNTQESNLGEWRAVETEVKGWYDARPVSFKPVFHQPADVSSDRPFPTLYFLRPVPVIAMQHYYAAEAVLCMYKFNDTQYMDSHGKQEFKISFYLCILMGLALSNPHISNAYYLPAHMLSLCGYCIRDLCQRTHSIRYLEKVDEVIKWKTKSLIKKLKEDWDN